MISKFKISLSSPESMHMRGLSPKKWANLVWVAEIVGTDFKDFAHFCIVARRAISKTDSLIFSQIRTLDGWTNLLLASLVISGFFQNIPGFFIHFSRDKKACPSIRPSVSPLVYPPILPLPLLGLLGAVAAYQALFNTRNITGVENDWKMTGGCWCMRLIETNINRYHHQSPMPPLPNQPYACQSYCWHQTSWHHWRIRYNL